MTQNSENINTTISFSIITPVYNRQDCISGCIESVLAQNYNHYEYIIIDDGSTDNTPSIVNDFAKKKSNIVFFGFPKNKGVNAARNKGIQLAKNQFILFLDSDDVLADGALDSIYNFIIQNPGYKHYLFGADDRMQYYESHKVLKNESVEITYKDWLSGNVSGDFIHVMEREMLKKFLFPEQFRIYEGLNFLRIYRYSEKQKFIKKTMVIRDRSRTDSVSYEYFLNKKKSIRAQFEANKIFLEWYGQDMIDFKMQKQFIYKVKKTILLGISLSEYKNNILLLNTLKKEGGQYIFLYILNTFHLGYFLLSAIILKSLLSQLLTK